MIKIRLHVLSKDLYMQINEIRYVLSKFFLHFFALFNVSIAEVIFSKLFHVRAMTSFRCIFIVLLYSFYILILPFDQVIKISEKCFFTEVIKNFIFSPASSLLSPQTKTDNVEDAAATVAVVGAASKGKIKNPMDKYKKRLRRMKIAAAVFFLLFILFMAIGIALLVLFVPKWSKLK